MMAKSLSINFGSGGSSSTIPPNLLIVATDGSGNAIDGTANVIQRPLTGYVVGANTVLAATDTILTAFQKLQGQVSARINNQTTVQAGASFNIGGRGIITQAATTAVATQVGTAGASPFTVTGGAGGSTSFSGATATGGAAGAINLTGGTGGSLTGTITGPGVGGKGGVINITGGNGGNTFTGTGSTGAGGEVEILGGTSGLGATVAGITNGRPGFVSVKGGNVGTGDGNGGHVYIVGGIPGGVGKSGAIFLGLSPADALRGTVFIGSQSVEYETATPSDKLYVKGRAKFVDTPVQGVPAVNPDEFLTSGQMGVTTLVRKGMFEFIPDDVTTSFTIPHNIVVNGVNTAPTWYMVFNLTGLSGNYSSRTITVDANNIIVTFANAPTSSDGTALFSWKAEI